MSDKLTLHDYEHASKRIGALERTWEREIAETIRRRQVRYMEISSEELRASGRLPLDGMHIPRRIAHNNIRREQAPIVAYFSQSKDVAKFRAMDDLPLPPDPLNREFTKFAQYPGWLLPHLQAWDGAATHGWAATETLFDPDYPGHFCNQYIDHERLWFAWDVTDIQHSPVVVICHYLTTVELDEYVEQYGFNAGAADDVRKHLEAQEDKSDVRGRVMKIFFKENGVVMVGWWSHHATAWLRAPEKLYLGVDSRFGPEPERAYPVEVLRYSISEDGVITNSKGRVFEDEPDQEACTQLATSFVNRAIRSQYLMFSPLSLTDDPSTQQTKVVVKDGLVMNQPVKEFQIEAPDPIILTAMETFINQNANDAGQVNFAARNRQDSRKTATEITASTQQGSMLNSVQVVLVSMYAAGVLNRDWRICQSQVQQGLLESALSNWQGYYGRIYTVLAAGDVDVIRRQEILLAMKQDWPVIQNTPAAQKFLEHYLRLAPYAEYAEELIAAIEQGNWKDNLIRGMANALKEISLDPSGQLKPDAAPYAKQLTEIQQEYIQVMTPPGQKPEEQPEQQAA